MGLSTYVPDRPPTWTEVGSQLLIVVGFGLSLQFRSLWLPAVITGFVVNALIFGPVANSAVGRRVEDWFRGIGASGRLTVIIGFAVTAVVGTQTALVSTLLLANFAYGGLAALVIFTVVHAFVAGEISGWWPDDSPVDDE